MKKMAFIYAKAKSLFLCATTLNYQAKITKSTEKEVELVGAPQYFPPSKGEKQWQGILCYYYDGKENEGLLE